MMRPKTASNLLACLILFLFAALTAHAQDVQRITKEKLKAELGQTPDLIILDVRTDRDWETSQWKIAGAVREDPSKAEEWKNKFSKNKTIVLYCA
jgi:rhodanese-related sulfurtransferase